jgi:tetratricopeptide (TPR) repeat protein
LPKYEEAEALFRGIIELRSSDRSLAWRDLADLVLLRLKDSALALDVARQAITDLPTDPGLLNGLAWRFYESGLPEHLAAAEGWARKAVELAASPGSIHTLACILARAGKVIDALQWTGKVLEDVEFVKKTIDDMVKLFAELVAAGAAEQAYPLLRDSKSATALEPVAVALQMHLGTEVHVAPEIAEVAKDVLKRFGEVGDRRSRGTKG